MSIPLRPREDRQPAPSKYPLFRVYLSRARIIPYKPERDWVPYFSRGTFPTLSRDPSFQETIKNPGKQPAFEKNDG